MSRENLVNNISTTLSAAITTTGATSCTITSATGFPAAPFRILIDSEIMLVTAISGTTLTITRGVESTTAATHSSGATVTASPITAAGFLQSGPTATALTTVLGSAYTIGDSVGTWHDTGFTITLPEAGTYALEASVECAFYLYGAIGVGEINCKLYDATAAADIANTTTLMMIGSLQVTSTAPGALFQQSTYLMAPLYTVTQSSIIHLYANALVNTPTMGSQQIATPTILRAIRVY